jgi:hypothetical protein
LAAPRWPQSVAKKLGLCVTFIAAA